MRLQVRALIEASIAHRTLVGRFLHVQNFVYGQRPRLAETLAAFGAFEWLFLRVNISERGQEKKNTRCKKYRITTSQ